MGAAAAVGIAGIAEERRRSAATMDLDLLVGSFTLLALTIALQLLPMPIWLVERISPSAARVLEQFEPGFRVLSQRHPLSIRPELTSTALILFAAVATTIVGGAAALSLTGVRRLAAAVAVIGVVLALVGIVQKPIGTNRIYGFWVPEQPGDGFGPFVNRNHFAGWTLMALPLTLGSLCASVIRFGSKRRQSLRERVVGFATSQASAVALYAMAVLVMALGLTMTMSRSGIAGLAIALIVTVTVVSKRMGAGSGRTLLIAYVFVIVLTAVLWTGADALVARFGHTNLADFEGRAGAWKDARDIFMRFPAVGTGLNTYGIATTFFQTNQLEYHFVQAHNDYLQLAAEGGVLLSVPAIACAVAFALTVHRRFVDETSQTTYWLRVGAVTGILAVALQEIVDFSLQMPGNAVLFATLCAIALHRTPVKNRHTK